MIILMGVTCAHTQRLIGRNKNQLIIVRLVFCFQVLPLVNLNQFLRGQENLNTSSKADGDKNTGPFVNVSSWRYYHSGKITSYIS